jgi:hypothetical protein
MARLYCLECHTVVGESVGDWQGDSGAGFGLCQTCGQHGGASRTAARSHRSPEKPPDAGTPSTPPVRRPTHSQGQSQGTGRP